MGADKIKAQRFCFGKLVFQKSDGRRGADAFRIIVLIQRAAHVESLSVKVKLAVAGLKMAKSKTVAGFIHSFSIAFNSDDRPIKMRMVWCPGFHFVH